MELYYEIVLVISLLLSLYYVFIWHRHFEIHITLIFVLIPITNLAFYLLSRAHSLEEALVPKKLTYIGGCYLILQLMMVVFSLCEIKIGKALKLLFYAVTTVIFTSSLTIGNSDLFYKTVGFERVDGVVHIISEYGTMHTVFYGMIFVYFIMSLGAIIYSYLHKNQISRVIIFLLFLTEVISMIAFFVGRMIFHNIELITVAYVTARIIYLIIIRQMCLYDISSTAVDSMDQTGNTGLVSFDFKYRYLGSNVYAKEIFPSLKEMTVDKGFLKDDRFSIDAQTWLDEFRKNNKNDKFYYEKQDNTYLIDINYLYDEKRKKGYQFVITDDTANQKYIKLINSYNTQLQDEVKDKTRHIVEMHDRLIMSMATMVESRDNSTGGHIRRTSEGVRILIDEIRKDNRYDLSEEFCADIIKAAPMHDLGKIAVDDQILRKPGRFTPEEFEKMKAHASEGARIVHEILEGTDDEEFKVIAENVAHYHHERYDGSGYPDGLKGKDIPLEARIMAIADVYDALVSKRVYKEKMSFEKADSIIMEGMGTQFDPELEPFYVSAREKLEQYYDSIEQ